MMIAPTMPSGIARSSTVELPGGDTGGDGEGGCDDDGDGGGGDSGGGDGGDGPFYYM